MASPEHGGEAQVWRTTDRSDFQHDGLGDQWHRELFDRPDLSEWQRHAATSAGADRVLPRYDAEDPKQLEKQFGVDIVTNGNHYEYHLHAGGKDQLLFCTAADQSGLQTAHEKLSKMVDDKESEIAAKFTGINGKPIISFAKAGESAGSQYHWVTRPDGTQSAEPNGKPILTRDPTLKELFALQAGLSHANPAANRINGKPLRIQALADPQFEGEDSSHGSATYEAAGQNGQHPGYDALHIEAGAGETYPPTDKDFPGGKPGPGGPPRSLDGVITHELGHRSEQRMGAIGPHGQNPYQSNLGWQRLDNPDHDWALNDKDGQLYVPVPGSNNDPATRWMPVNSNGQSADRTAGISNEEMMERARVRPGTGYFINPDEEMAEALADYRRGPQSRQDFLQRSADCYAEAKCFDQSELDRVYGAGRKIRLPDGSVSDNTSQNREIVREFERGAGSGMQLRSNQGGFYGR